MRFNLMVYVSAAAACAFLAGTGSAQDRFIPVTQVQKAEPSNRFVNEAAAFADGGMPDGAEIIAVFRAAKTVADIEAGNRGIVMALGKIQSIETRLSRLATAARSCDQTDLPDVAAFQGNVNDMEVKAVSFEGALVDIERRMKKSIESMQSHAAFGKFSRKENSDFKRNEQLRRYQIAYSEFGRLRVQAQETRKSIGRTSVVVLNAQCQLGTIPPLYESEKIVLPQAARKRPLNLNP